MQILSLEKMEEIVKKNKSLKWDGWDVIHFYPSDRGRTSKYGLRIGSKWYLHKRFPITENGWDIPNKLAR